MCYNDWYECFNANCVCSTVCFYSAFTLISHSNFIRLIHFVKILSFCWSCCYSWIARLFTSSLTHHFFNFLFLVSHSLANQKNRSHKQALIGVGCVIICQTGIFFNTNDIKDGTKQQQQWISILSNFVSNFNNLHRVRQINRNDSNYEIAISKPKCH